MGQSAKAPPAPDFSNVIKNVQDTANQLMQWGRQGFNWGTGQLDTMQPYVTSGQNLAAGLAGSAAGAADQQRAGYQRYLPVMQRNIDQSMDWDSPANIARLQSQSAGSIAQQFGAAGDAAKANLRSFGVKPTDLRMSALDLPAKLMQAATTAGQNNAIATAVPQQAFGMRQGVIQTGLGEAGLANQTTGTALSGATTPTAIGTSYMNAAFPWLNPLGYGTAAGGLYSNVGDITAKAYQTALAQFQAQQAANKEGSGVGTGLGIGSTLLGKGGIGSLSGMFGGGGSSAGAAAGTAGGAGAGELISSGMLSGIGGVYAEGGPVRIEGGRRPGQDYASVHANEAPRSYGHLQQPHSTGAPAERAAYPRVNGSFGPGTYQEPVTWQQMVRAYVGGGPVDFAADGGYVSPSLSPSRGGVIDDIPATVQSSGQPARINAGEFIFTAKAAREIGVEKLRKMMAKAEAAADGEGTPGGSRDQAYNQGRRPAFAGFDRGGGVGAGLAGRVLPDEPPMSLEEQLDQAGRQLNAERGRKSLDQDENLDDVRDRYFRLRRGDVPNPVMRFDEGGEIGSGVGGVIGGVIGSVYGGPWGGMAGSQAGQRVGRLAGNVISGDDSNIGNDVVAVVDPVGLGKGIFYAQGGGVVPL